MEMNVPQLNLLPTEILLKIFEYLDPIFLSRTITRVCVRFANILKEDELFWKQQLNTVVSNFSGRKMQLRNPYNSGRNILWRDIAVNFSLLEQKWQVRQSQIRTENIDRLRYTRMYATKILPGGTVIVCGGRDWLFSFKINSNTQNLEAGSSAFSTRIGWIWCTNSYETETFFTGSWDNNVVHWATEGFQHIRTFNCGQPVKAISTTRSLVAAGLLTSRIVLLDPRTDNSVRTISFWNDTQTVTDVLLLPQQNLLLSTSEDRLLRFFDIRCHKQCYNAVRISQDNSYPTCLGFYQDLIYIGDTQGNIHLSSIGGAVTDIITFNTGTNSYVASVVPHISGVTIGSWDSHVKIISSFTTSPVVIWNQEMNSQITSVDQHKDLIAVLTRVGTVTLFKSAPC